MSDRNRCRLQVERLEDRTAPAILGPGLEMTEYFRYTTSGGGGPGELAFGQGGLFANDLYFVDNGVRLHRVADLNADNDALDPGEGTIMIQFSGGERPGNVHFGNGVGSFGNDLFLVDDGFNRITRLSDDTGSFVRTGFSSGAFFTPTAAAYTPDGSAMLVTDAWVFTMFGGGADGRILRVTQTGAATLWANGNQLPNGLWDVNGYSVETTADGWSTLVNHSIAGFPGRRELVQFRDNNGDGDALDAGEARVLLPQAAALAFPRLIYGPIVRDSSGAFYTNFGNNTQGISRFEDLNGDGDFWDGASNSFDPGERTLILDDIPGTNLRGMEFGPDGALYVGAVTSSTQAVIYRIAPAAPVNQPPTANPGGPYSVGEGGNITLNGSASNDTDGTIASYEWDLDYDGVSFNADATGPAPLFDAAALDGNSSRTIALRVTDDDGAPSAVVSATIAIANLDPSVTAVANNGPVDEGSPVEVSVTATDAAGANDPLSYEFDFDNDGIFEIGPQASNSATHIFASAAYYQINARVTDGDGGAALGATFVIVNPVPTSVDFSVGPGQVNLNGNGVLPVALFSTSAFDVTTLDVATLRLAGAVATHSAFQDVNGDGLVDLLLHFRRQDFVDEYAAALAADLADGTLDDNHQLVELALTGKTLDGGDVAGIALIDLFMTGKKLNDLLATL